MKKTMFGLVVLLSIVGCEPVKAEQQTTKHESKCVQFDGGCAKASSFGWNAEDATASLQNAIDTGAKRVIVDRQAGDWIVRPILLRSSNQEIVIEDGVTIRAKKGEFKGRNDCLVKVPAGVSNIVLRGEGRATLVMNKKDYQNPDEYVFSEWRNTVSITGGRDITVSNLTLLSSGGDGVYVRGAARNVRLDNLICRDHHRQGISVISAVGLYVKNCRFEATSGAAPQCGVDVEPNTPRDRLENIIFENCEFNDNASSGIFMHLCALDGTTRPISIVFRHCKAFRNRNCGIKVTCASARGAVRGTVLFDDCETAGNNLHAFGLDSKRYDALDIMVRNCVFDSSKTTSEEIKFNNGTFLVDFGGVLFDNVRVIAGKGRPVVFDGAHGTGIAPGTIRGNVDVLENGVFKKLSMKTFSESYPPQPEVLKALLGFKTSEIDYRAIKPVFKEKLPKSDFTGWLRGRFTFVQCFPVAGEYPVVFHVKPLGNRRPSAKVQMRDSAGTDLGSYILPAGVHTNVIQVTGAGVRRFEVVMPSGVMAIESIYPGHGLQADGYVHLFGGKNRRYWFFVPADAENVSVEIKPEEPCSAKLLRPDGSVAAEMQKSSKMVILECKRSKSATGEIWSIEFPYVREDAKFRVGAPTMPFVSPTLEAVIQ
jgi:hypothetical protein